MPRTSHPVIRALARWEGKGLLSPDLAGTLRTELLVEEGKESMRWSQFLLAITAGAVLVVAGGTFLTWAWPALGPGSQAITLGVVGLLILGLGLRIPGSGRLQPVSFLLQLSGGVLLFMALVYSEKAWIDGSSEGVVAGLLGLVIPGVLVWISLGKAPVLAAFQAALGFLFLYAFFDRAFAMETGTILWILDGVMVAALVFVGYRLADPEGPEWTLPMAVVFTVSVFVLLAMSGDMVWDLEGSTIIPMDLWLLAVGALAYWGLQESAPPHLRRDWYEKLLALCVVAGIPFGFVTTLEAFNTGETAAALTVGGVGGVALWYGIPRRSRSVMVAGCLALFIAAWYYGAETGGALGAVLALAVVSGLLFWGAMRLGGRSRAAGE